MTGVSVVLPTYNRAHTLARAIGSVLAQSHRDLEVIVVDDGSTDGTPAVVEQIGAADPRVRLIRQPQNSGPSAARNAGVAAAAFELVAFQDSDDEWAPGKLAEQVAAIEGAPDVVLVTCGFVIPGDPAHSQPGSGEPAVIDLTPRVLEEVPSCQCWLLRRATFLQLGGFDVALDCFEDWELALRLAGAGRVLTINSPLVTKHATPGSLFADHRFSRNLQRILARHADRLREESAVRARFAILIAQAEGLQGSMREARRWFLQSLSARPLAPRAWLSLAVTFLGRGLFTSFIRSARAARSRLPAAVPSRQR